MKYRIIAVGRIREAYVNAAVDDFRKRFRRYEALDEIEVSRSHRENEEQAMREESGRILTHVAPADTVWLLERTGVQLSSTDLAERLAATARAGTARLTFVIAGTFGADPALLARADFTWSLSRLTLLHEWARALVLEQLYRAAKITRNEPYHH